MLAGPPPSAFAVINGAAAAAAGSGSSSARPAPDAAATAGSAAQLARWNVQANRLPDPARIKAVHVYDFDNTLFATPLPNRKIWSNESLARLAELSYFSHGGWWHDARILAATGKGVDAEEPVAWKGWWNENIVKLVQLSMEQKDALTVLLTGRSAKKFAPLIQRMVGARKLEFDLFVLKPDADQYGNPWKSTLACKEAFLGELLDYYREAEEFRIYEDRVKHVRAFEDFSKSYVDALRPGSRLPLNMEVIQVAELGTTLDPATELAEVQTMVDSHNTIVASEKHRAPGILHLRRTVFYTGYLLSAQGSTALLNALEIPRMVSKESDVKLMANSVLITPRPAPLSVLSRAGGLGAKLEFEVVGLGQLDEKVWAAKVQPVDPSVKVYTDNPVPLIVLAVRRNAKPADANRITSWLPPPKTGLRFSTIVGEKQLLRIEEEAMYEAASDRSSNFHNPRRGTTHARTPPHVDRDRDRRDYYHGGHAHNGYYDSRDRERERDQNRDRDRDRERDREHYRGSRGDRSHRGGGGGRAGRGAGAGRGNGSSSGGGGAYRGRGAARGASRDVNIDSMGYLSDLY